jgi:hypothetical protein
VRDANDRAPWSDPYTDVPTWDGMAYVAFVFDVFSRMVSAGAPPPR